MSAAHHYGWRDFRLHHVNGIEFTRSFKVEKMDKADREWAEKAPAYDLDWHRLSHPTDQPEKEPAGVFSRLC